MGNRFARATFLPGVFEKSIEGDWSSRPVPSLSLSRVRSLSRSAEVFDRRLNCLVVSGAVKGETEAICFSHRAKLRLFQFSHRPGDGRGRLGYPGGSLFLRVYFLPSSRLFS